MVDPAQAQTGPGSAVQQEDRVFICNEDSNTLAVIDPRTNTIETTVNLTSFDEDPRPPFRFVTGGIAPTHVAMIQKPLYHGAISIHGAAPSPDNTLIATTGRGSRQRLPHRHPNEEGARQSPKPAGQGRHQSRASLDRHSGRSRAARADLYASGQ